MWILPLLFTIFMFAGAWFTNYKYVGTAAPNTAVRLFLYGIAFLTSLGAWGIYWAITIIQVSSF